MNLSIRFSWIRLLILQAAILIVPFSLAEAVTPNPLAEFTMVGSRDGFSDYRFDSIDFVITIHSGPLVTPGTYNFDFGISPGSASVSVLSTGKFDPTASSGTVSADGFSVTFDRVFTFNQYIFGSTYPDNLHYINTYNYTFNLTFGTSTLWTQPIALKNYWYWESYLWGDQVTGYGGGFAYTSNPRPAVNSPQNYSINLPGAPVGPPDQSPSGGSCPCCKAMPGYSFDMLRAGLIVNDTPISYHPPLGPDISFTTTYNQRDVGQSGAPPVAGLGPLWSYNALSYIIGSPPGAAGTVSRFVPGGGIEVYTGFQVTGLIHTTSQTQYAGYFAPERNSQATLLWDPSIQQYTRILPSGGSETYGFSVASGGTTYFLLTMQTDPQGNTVSYGYDSSHRLVTITDAIGQVTTLSYTNTNPLLITGVTDPFGRSVNFTYDSSGRLSGATDPIGIVSSYGYDSTNFLNSLTTPYGTTTFSTDSDANHQAVQATNPLTQTERVELRFNSPSGISDTDTAPAVLGLFNGGTTVSGLSQNNTFYWDRRQYTSTLNYANAVMTHWMGGPRGLTNVIASQKQPLEGRIWFAYQGQTQPDFIDDTATGLPVVTARFVGDGTATSANTQATYATYNSNGLVLTTMDALNYSPTAPAGRTTNYAYASNGIDLTQVAQTNSTSGTGQDILSVMSYNSLHEPLTISDASGRAATMTYNTSNGQLLTRTNAKSEMTTMAYDSSGYLTSVTGPVAHAVTGYTYDSLGRVASVTDLSDNSNPYTLNFAYDYLDRQTTTTYPDSTTDQTVYGTPTSAWPLDVDHVIDRQGRTTNFTYDAIREKLTATDPKSQVTTYTWCTCGGLASLKDANNHTTTWSRDLQGRATAKIYADSTQITYNYEAATSRLASMGDANGNSAAYTYNLDNTLASTAYTSGTGISATPSVSFTYDTAYNRVLQMVEGTGGTGTTIYAYNSIPTNAQTSPTTGAGRLSTVTVPIAGTTAAVAYTYDELGRVTGRTIDGTANSTSTTFDSLARVTGVSNPLGAFTYAYVDASSRLSSMTAPSGTGLSTVYSYFGGTGDLRLQEISNLKGSTNLSDFQYTYNPVGTIATWRLQADANTPTQYALTYDNDDQLTNAVQTNTSTSAVVSSNAYGYDSAGNRLSETVLGITTTGTFNSLNQLTNLSSALAFTGSVNKPVTLTLNGTLVALGTGNSFSSTITLPPGLNTVTMVAQDSAGNKRTNKYQVYSGLNGSPTYDNNGNTHTDENGNTYTWDALNRLVKIAYPSTAYTTMAYDGLSRRTQIAEYDSTGFHNLTSTKNYLWVGSEIAEERGTIGTTTESKRFFPQGEQQTLSGTTTPYYYTRDHEGSVHEMCDSSGTIVSRMAYDCFGRMTVVSGTNLPTKQYMGYYQHQKSGLELTKYRAYDSNLGRWLSRDSIGERGGINLYEFDLDNPVNKVDISGRSPLGIAAVGSPFVACALYAQVLKDWIKSHYGDKGSGDALEHCFLSCRLSRVCGGPIAIIAGSVNEIKDRSDGDNTPAGSYDDLKSDFACISTESVILGAPGGWLSQVCRQSCAKCCADKIKWGTYNRP